MPNKICPSCHIDMREIDLKTKYGVPLVIEQCDKCGGLWFDDLEMYLSKMGDSATIDGVDIKKLREYTESVPLTLRCPNDQEVLSRFEDASFPESLELDSCPHCKGFWLNRGEFLRFQEHRQAMIDKHAPQSSAVSDREVNEADKKFGEQLDRMMTTSSAGTYQSLGALGSFLSRPMNPVTNRPIGIRDNDSGERTGELVALALMAVRLLIKLFAK